MTPRHTRISTPLGPYVLAAEDDAIIGLWRDGQAHYPASGTLGEQMADPAGDPLLDRAVRQLQAYLDGRASVFTLPLAPRGTEFQQRVWARLREVSFGRTTTYGQIARDLGNPRAAQAVGAAVGRNPISIIIPCHRVLAGTGALTGYAGGMDTKTALLRLEGVLGA